jgi:acyl carrier protein
MAEVLTWSDYIDSLAEYVGINKDEIGRTTRIYNDLGIDSLGLFSVGMELIKKYGCRLPLATVSSMETVEDLYNEMRRSLSPKNTKDLFNAQ